MKLYEFLKISRGGPSNGTFVAVRLTPATVRKLVRRGAADIGLVVRANAEPLESFGGFGDAPLLIIADPARGVAVPMLAGQIQKAYFAALPDVSSEWCRMIHFHLRSVTPRTAQPASGSVSASRRGLGAALGTGGSGCGFGG